MVDDHPLVLEAMRRLLTDSREDIDVVGEATTAEEALELIEGLKVDVVVMDIRLPGMDGVEATKKLKERYPDMKVIILSSFGQEYLMPSIEAGADGYLLKTSAPTKLVQGLMQVAHGQATNGGVANQASNGLGSSHTSRSHGTYPFSQTARDTEVGG